MEKGEEGREKVANTPPSEPERPKALRPRNPKPPNKKPNTPLPHAVRDMAPNPENGIYEISKQTKGQENRSELAW